VSTDPFLVRFYKTKLETTEKLLAINAQLETYPAWKQVRQPEAPISIAKVQQQLIGADGKDALIEFVLSEEKVIQFVIRRDTAFVHVSPFHLDLKNAASIMRDSLAALADIAPNSTRAKVATDRFIQAAQLLYKNLIAPVQATLRENLLIVPDGIMGQIPFDALLTANPPNNYAFNQYPFLIKTYNIHYTWTATLQLDLIHRQKTVPAEYRLVAFAPFGKPDTTLDQDLPDLMAQTANRSDTLSVLKYSHVEASAAAQLMQGLAFSDSSATKNTFLQYAAQSRILHLATHASSNVNNSDFGWIAFYTGTRDSAERLYTREIYPLRISADLVVLSACESGVGSMKAGEGTMSLGRAFAWAGAQSIIASNWKADDASTERLMIQFYKNLNAGQDRANALRNAKLSLLTEPSRAEKRHQPDLKAKWRHQSNPVFWAGFFLMGRGD
jgi:CHAT domain-containing protein